MKHRQQPYPPLLAVLLFGDCGGVRGPVKGTGRERHTQFRAVFARWQPQRALARQRLHRRARRAALQRLDSVETARIASLLRCDDYRREKDARRRRKMTRQLLAPDNRPLGPAIRIPVNTRRSGSPSRGAVFCVLMAVPLLLHACAFPASSPS